MRRTCGSEEKYHCLCTVQTSQSSLTALCARPRTVIEGLEISQDHELEVRSVGPLPVVCPLFIFQLDLLYPRLCKRLAFKYLLDATELLQRVSGQSSPSHESLLLELAQSYGFCGIIVGTPETRRHLTEV
jgi:hypothetical protein